jgi:lysine-N-methylase
MVNAPTDAQLAWFLEGFSCLGGACEDTCCKGWGMQLSSDTLAHYQQYAPELLAFVTTGEAQHIMKRDEKTDYCMKYDNGWCGIHKDYGTDMLGDACHFFPRSTKKLGNQAVMSAALSCPEVTRALLFKSRPDADYVPVQLDRLPHSVKNYQPDNLDADKAMQVHQAFLQLANDDSTPLSDALTAMSIAVASLHNVSTETWGVAAPFYIKSALSSLPEVVTQPHDHLNLLNMLHVLVHLAPASERSRLNHVIATMDAALDVQFDPSQLTVIVGEQTAEKLAGLQVAYYGAQHDTLQDIMRRWAHGQVSLAMFPYAGLGQTMEQRAIIIAVRFATVQLALLAHIVQYGTLEDADAVRIIQSLSRFLDHLAEPTTSMALYEQAGWTDPARLRGLLAGF